MARPPDYRLSILNKRTDARNMNAGAGWKNADGSVSIVLSACVTIPQDENLVVTLFPLEDREQVRPREFRRGKVIDDSESETSEMTSSDPFAGLSNVTRRRRKTHEPSPF